jgi:redox-sensitive bicupin YhaK (pirin superfamily)
MLIQPRSVKLTTRTGVEVRRTLPHRDLKMIGAWCFVDHFGPTEQTDGMVVAAHPHTGLQTATWLIEGAIEHRDSIGSVQIIKPGQLNLMTAGHGIAHSEISLTAAQQPGANLLHAVQLWIALPKDAIETAPDFEHQSNLPRFTIADGPAGSIATATVLAGEFMGHVAQTKTFSPLIGVEIRVRAGQTIEIPLNPAYEYGFMLVEGQIALSAPAAGLNNTDIPVSGLEYLEKGPDSAILTAGTQDSIILLLGGKPFGEKILMWWNFIGRTHQDISRAREEWNAALASRFPSFEDEIGGRIPAPDLPNVQLNAR